MNAHKVFRMVLVLTLTAAFAAMTLGAFAQATPPGRVNYQGVLRDASGNPLSGAQSMTFRFYDAASGGTVLWEETYSATYPPQITATSGLFTVALGDSAHRTNGSETLFPNVFANHATVYLAVAVGLDAEMTPRIQVVAAPFAENTASLQGRQAASFANAAHTHAASDITSGTLAIAQGGTGLSSPGASGNILTSNGSAWTSAAPPSAGALGAVVDAADATLTRTGSGTGADPYKLKLNLANANAWSGAQTFNANSYFPGSGVWNTSGNIGIGTPSPGWPLTIQASQAVAQLVTTASGNGGSVVELKNSNSSPATLGAINFNNAANSYPGQIAYTGASDSAPDNMIFKTAAAERMRIGSSGNVGIGTAPNANARLDVKSSASGEAQLGYADIGVIGTGNQEGGSFASANASGTADVAIGDQGIVATGNYVGGLFYSKNASGRAYAGYGDDGIDASGNNAGGSFKSANASGYAYVGYGDYGICAYGNTAGARFGALNNNGHAEVGIGSNGIEGFGNGEGGYFANLLSGSYASVGANTYKILGSGAVSFVQNHPTEKDKVIVYACPEGDEVATYTRGTAKLVNGEARVQLGETFKWVTNPDIGLTAHLTPKGDCNGLYAESVSTTEMVVKELNGGKSNTAFDYIVYGLRIGFEESSIVQEKQQESYIPSFKYHRDLYASHPELRHFDALERFKTMESSVSGVSAASIDLSRAKALHDAIHEYDPSTDPPVEKLFGHDHGHGKPEQTPPPASARPALPPNPTAGPLGNGGAISNGSPASGGQGNALPSLPVDADGNVYGNSFRPASADFAASFPVCGPVEAGDVLVTDANHPGAFCRSLIPNDPGVVGVVAGEPGVLLGSAPKGSEPALLSAPVATSGIVKVKVDAGYGPIALNDLLVASPTPGRAMRADNPAQGTVIGKALEPLATGTGTIKVLVMMR